MSRRAAIVGAGPSGFYAADQLHEAGFEVDLLDLLPTPFGLVRAGVAPDHQRIKSVTRVYEKCAAKPGFRFFGGVTMGRHVSRAELLDRYHAVIYALGTPNDTRLGIPGEDRPGSHSATEFVSWYNGHPDGCNHDPDLGVHRAVVVGNGNVAIDVARMLVLHPDELSCTDAADHAIEALAQSALSEVVVLGRRGPAQASFTNPELRELAHLRRARVEACVEDLELDEHSAAWLLDKADATSKRNVEILRAFAEAPPRPASHRIVLGFLRSPVRILGEGHAGRVTGIEVMRNRIEPADGGALRAVPTGKTEVIECGLVLRSIGYRGRPVEDVPFDERRGLIPNLGGRVVDEAGRPHRGEYVVGWIKRGPSGVIGTNKKDAADTVARLAEDAHADALNTPTEPGAESSARFFAERAPDAVTWQGWQAIDVAEKAVGQAHGRPRVKLVRVAELVRASRTRLTS